MTPILSHLPHLAIKSDEPKIAIGVFDFDGNILMPNTYSYLIEKSTGKEVPFPAHEVDQNPDLISGEDAEYMWNPDFDMSVREFTDFFDHPDHRWADQLIENIRDAIDRNAFSSSFDAFKNTFLIPARFFCIITARRHSADNLARAMEVISEATLTESQKESQYQNIKKLYDALGRTVPLTNELARRFYFTEIASYYPVSNIHLRKILNMTEDIDGPHRKVIAMNNYLKDIKRRLLAPLGDEHAPLSIGFSDDSIGNINAMIGYFVGDGRTKWRIREVDKARIYFSGRQDHAHKINIHEEIDITPGETITTIRF